MYKAGFRILFVVCLAALVLSCKKTIDVNRLYGSWKYTRIEHPNADAPDTVTRVELEDNNPSIVFSTNNKLTINWGGKILSSGKFRIENDNIYYTENLADGKTREFPFWVSKLTDKEIIFETTGKDGSRVTATKQ